MELAGENQSSCSLNSPLLSQWFKIESGSEFFSDKHIPSRAFFKIRLKGYQNDQLDELYRIIPNDISGSRGGLESHFHILLSSLRAQEV